MKAIEFEEVNVKLAEEQEEYETLPVYVDSNDPSVPMVACFELSDEEAEKIFLEKKIWLAQLTFGRNYAPVKISVNKEDVI